jgi:hypothetical protein
MDGATDPVTLALTGMFPAAVLLAALLSFPIAWLLLRWYHRSVERGMRASSGGSPAAPPPSAPAGPTPDTALAIRDVAPAGARSPQFDFLLKAPRNAAAVYVLAGVAYALVMTLGWMLATRLGFSLMRVAVIFWTYFWPAVLGAALVGGADRGRWRLVAGYFAVLLVVAFVGYTSSPNGRWFDTAVFWLLTNAAPTVLLAAFLARRIRAVGPMVLAFMVLALLGSQLPATLLGNREAPLRALVRAGALFGLGGSGIFWGLMLAGAAVFAVIGWALLGWLGRAYERKRITDQMLTTDAMWLLFGMLQSFSLVFEHWAWIFSGLVAFLAFALARRLGFRALRAQPRPTPRTLLLLRVFALGARSGRLFDVLQAHWLRQGNITMIAGPDLVTTTVEPHEFLGFLSGRLSRQFVQGRADLDARIARMDTAMDVDGRFRVNEFFCLADTWQMVMRELASRSDAVLMDLRSFSPERKGCLYELGELLKAVDLRRVLLVVDATTDRAFLEDSLWNLWEEVPEGSPNRASGDAEVRLFLLADPPGGAAWKALLGALS